MVHAIAVDLGRPSWPSRLAALLTVVAGIAVFGWSVRLVAFIAFALAAASFGILDRHRTGSWRVMTGWAVAAALLVVGAVQIADKGVGGLAAPTVGAVVAAAGLIALSRLYPGGIESTDVAAGSFAAFALTTFGWHATTIAFVAAAAMSGVLGGRAILRQGRRGVAVPFAACLALSTIVTALLVG